MATANRVIKNTVFLYFRLIVTLVVSLWTTRIVLEALGIDNFGIYNVVGGAIALLGFFNASLSTSSQRFLSYAEGQGNKYRQIIVFNCCFILHIAIGVIISILFILTGIIFFNGVLNIPENRVFAAKIVYASMGISTIASILSVPYEATVNAHENMKYYAFIGIVEVLLKLLIAFLVIYVDSDKLIIYGILMASIHILTFLIIRTYCHNHYRECVFNLTRYVDKPTIKEIGAFAGWNLLTSSSSIVTQYGLNIIINHFFGVIINAAQGIASQVSGVLSNLSTNALKALNPIIVKSESQANRDRMLYISMIGCRVSFFIFGLLSLPIMLNVRVILTLWLIEVPQWTEVFCQLAILRILLEQLTFALNTSIMARGKIGKYNIYRSLFNLLPLIIIPILFIFDLAPYWMYIIWIICWSCIGGIITLLFCHTLIGLSIKYYMQTILLPCLLIWCLAYGVGIGLLNPHHSLGYNIIVSLFCFIGYMTLSWFWIFTRNERQLITGILKRKK